MTLIMLETWAGNRSDSENTVLHLKMEQAVFGVNGCLNDANHRGHFVYRVDVTVSPSREWMTKVHTLSAEPAADTSIDMIGKQVTHFTNLIVERCSIRLFDYF